MVKAYLWRGMQRRACMCRRLYLDTFWRRATTMTQRKKWQVKLRSTCRFVVIVFCYVLHSQQRFSFASMLSVGQSHEHPLFTTLCDFCRDLYVLLVVPVRAFDDNCCTNQVIGWKDHHWNDIYCGELDMKPYHYLLTWPQLLHCSTKIPRYKLAYLSPQAGNLCC